MKTKSKLVPFKTAAILALTALSVWGLPAGASVIVSNGDFTTSPTEALSLSWVGPSDPLNVWYGRTVTAGIHTATVGSQENLWVTSDPNNTTEPYIRPAQASGPGMYQVIAYPGDGLELTYSFDYFNTDATGNNTEAPSVTFYGLDDGDEILKFFAVTDWTQIGSTFTPASNTADTFTNTGEQSVTLSGTYQYLAVSLKEGSIDNFILNSPAPVVPEPISLALLGLGTLLLLAHKYTGGVSR